MLRLRSHAKINWALEVVGRRSDGYHELRTLFQTISLADEIEVEECGGGIELAVEETRSPMPPLADDASNLAWRAARLFLDSFAGGPAGVRIRLRKRIPVGGGLGGGSANAATILAALARLHPEAPPLAALEPLAARLGADVPYFLRGGVAIGTGRGDILRELPDDAIEEEEIRLAVPPFGVSSGEAFAALGASLVDEPSAHMQVDWPGALPRRLSRWRGRNDLERASFALRPELGRMYNSLLASGASWVRMSGSGSTLVAIFDRASDAERAGAALPEGVEWLRARTLRRSTWRDSTGI
ncbi:MAG: 4-(cytidine 5'-diphospho)-2-C-methyl-D-erythritol kinase [Thermoanaerobaculia bacterium]